MRSGLGRWIRRGGAVIVAVGVLVVRLAAQQQSGNALARAADLERRGDYVAATDAYRGILRANPGDLGALLGLERALQAMNKLGEMTPDLAAAMSRGAPSSALLGLAVRVWTVARQPDSVRAAVNQWVTVESGSEAPFQEWGMAALGVRDRAFAKEAYTEGRRRLNRPDALAGETAQLATIEGDYALAVTEWLVAVRRTPSYRTTAVALLGQASQAGRPRVLEALGAAGRPDAERIAAMLQVRWGDPVAGVRRVERLLPALGPQTPEALQEMLDELRGVGGRDGVLARGMTLELLAAAVPGAQASRFYIDAAQAYAEAGEQTSARRMLAKLAADSNSSTVVAASAASTLVGVLVTEGKMDEADRRFTELKKVLNPEARQTLALKVAAGWIKAGRLERAEATVGADSTVEALSLRGKIQLYQGHLGEAAELLKMAGPFAGERDASTDRTSVLSVLQVIEADSLPALGKALFELERRDSSAAAAGLESVGAKLPPDKGGAEVLLLAGRIRSGLKEDAAATQLFRTVADLKIPASAAQAELELGRLLMAHPDRKPAVEVLEHLLVTYPSSAVAPYARRLLDQARGAVPPS